MSFPFSTWAPRTASSSTRSTPPSHTCCRSGRFVLGPEVESFEHCFAAYTGAKHCVGVGNGLEALALALAAHGIGNGDEVIVPAATAVATWLAVTQVGAVPVPAAVSEATWTLEPDRLDAAVTPRTRAVIPVHLYGHPADLGPICDLARRYGLVVIDDRGPGPRGTVPGASDRRARLRHDLQLLSVQEPGGDGRRGRRHHRR